jgi:DinB family protein
MSCSGREDRGEVGMSNVQDRATRLIATFNARWDDFVGSYAGLPEGALVEPGVVEEWSIKDLVAHVTIWENEALEHLPIVASGRRPPRYSVTYGGIDVFNDQAMARTRRLTVGDVLRERDEVHRTLLEYLSTLPPTLLATNDRFRRRLRLDTYGHYAIHTSDIRAWRDAHS